MKIRNYKCYNFANYDNTTVFDDVLASIARLRIDLTHKCATLDQRAPMGDRSAIDVRGWPDAGVTVLPLPAALHSLDAEETEASGAIRNAGHC